jgi:hypothetical protein
MARSLEELRKKVNEDKPIRLASGPKFHMGGVLPAAVEAADTVARTGKTEQAIRQFEAHGGNAEQAKQHYGVATSGNEKGPYAISTSARDAGHEGVHNIISKAADGNITKMQALYAHANSQISPEVLEHLEHYLADRGYTASQQDTEFLPHLRDMFVGRERVMKTPEGRVSTESRPEPTFKEFLISEGMELKEAEKLASQARRDYVKVTKEMNSLKPQDVTRIHDQYQKQVAEDLEHYFSQDKVDSDEFYSKVGKGVSRTAAPKGPTSFGSYLGNDVTILDRRGGKAQIWDGEYTSWVDEEHLSKAGEKQAEVFKERRAVPRDVMQEELPSFDEIPLPEDISTTGVKEKGPAQSIGFEAAQEEAAAKRKRALQEITQKNRP